MPRLRPLVIVPVALITAAVIALVITDSFGSTPCVVGQGGDGPPPGVSTPNPTQLAQWSTSEYSSRLTPDPTTEMEPAAAIQVASGELKYWPEYEGYFKSDPANFTWVDGWMDVRPPEPPSGGAVGGIAGLPDVSGAAEPCPGS